MPVTGVELEKMLDGMVRSAASALHLVAGRPPCTRLRGVLVPSQSDPLEADDLWQLVDELATRGDRVRLEAGEEINGIRANQSGISFRYTFMLEQSGPHLVFRRVAPELPSLEDLGLPELIEDFASLRSGLVLVTGFLGSGRSTTLSAIVDHASQTAPRHIITIEQPIEHLHEPQMGVVHQCEVGRHVRSFAQGVREATRHSPDVLMVGQVRDEDTLLAVLEAAERGILVFAGLPSSSVVGALEYAEGLVAEEADRMVRRLADVLRAVVAQTLLQSRGGRERVPLLEVLINSKAARRAILAREFEELPAIMERSRGLGMQTVDRGLKRLLHAKHITLDEALYHAQDRKWLYGRGPQV